MWDGLPAGLHAGVRKQVNENQNMWGMLTAESFVPVMEFDFFGPDAWALLSKSEKELAAMAAGDKLELRSKQVSEALKWVILLFSRIVYRNSSRQGHPSGANQRLTGCRQWSTQQINRHDIRSNRKARSKVIIRLCQVDYLQKAPAQSTQHCHAEWFTTRPHWKTIQIH